MLSKLDIVLIMTRPRHVPSAMYEDYIHHAADRDFELGLVAHQPRAMRSGFSIAEIATE